MRWILRFRVFIIISLAVILISAAVIFSVLRAVLPYATGYKNEIQQEISQQIGLPVEIDSIDAAIHWFSPRLKLIGVSVYDNKNKVPLFNFQEAFVELDVAASILHRAIIVDDIGLVGADISIEKLSDNEWMVQGIRFTSEGSSELPDQFLYMLQNADYLLHDSNIYYQDHTGDKLNLSLLDVNMDVKNSFNNHEIRFSMNLPADYGEYLAVVASLSGDIDSLDGDIYVEAHKLKIKQWNTKFRFLKSHKLDASIDVNIWATLEANKIEKLIADLTASNVSIKNNETGERWSSEFLSTRLRYIDDDERLSVAVSDFYFGNKLKPEWDRPVNIMAVKDSENYYLSADFLRVSDVQDLAGAVLSKEHLAELQKIREYRFNADIYNLDVSLANEISKETVLQDLDFKASVVNFSLHDEAHGMSLAGIDAAIEYSDNTATVDVVTDDAEVELKELFREKIIADTVQGKLALQYSDKAWQISSNQLQVKNAHINTFSRFDIQLSPENKIFIDAETDFYDGYGKYAGRYLPVGVMKPKLIDWLDMAVTSGYVPHGKFILHGNLSDFPYRDHNGIFQVLFNAENVDMRFLQDWPLLTGTSATIKFDNLSLTVSNAEGATHKASLFNGYAEIADLTNPVLTVTTDAHTSNKNAQSYVWDSPLDKILGNAMRLFQFDGESNLKLKLDVPLNNNHQKVGINGRMSFINTGIYYNALGYELKDVNGAVDFTEDTLFAESVSATIENRPVVINIFTQESAAGRENVFHLDGVIAADYLLQHYEWIPENWILGESLWSINIEVPYHHKDYLLHVNAHSDLENAVLKMSDKVSKPAASKIDFTADIDVLDKNGLHVDAKAVELDDTSIVNVYAVRNQNSVWAFDVNSAYISGKGEFTEGLDKATRIKLELDNVDVHALFVTKNNTSSKPLQPSAFPPLSWKAGKVLWDDWTFTDVSLETDWNEHGMLINKLSLTGPAMKFDARGTWLTSWRNSHDTVLQGTITSSNIGETLTGLGFQRIIDRAKNKASFNAKWPAEPYGFSWANMKGETSFEMENGEILEVDPGASGRILGLMNIFKLTNRLAFDFDDVTRKGFSFDSIKGDFEFVNGAGSLKNFDVSAPAADINMFGSIGMVDRDYGLLMRVKPHTDTLTLAGGTLLGGFAVGAGLALIQKVFDLGVIGHNVYSITGSWDDPKIEKIIERSQATVEDEDF